ncbi:MAG: hypothetical protein ABI904_08495 [Chloroflexota bacterium]
MNWTLVGWIVAIIVYFVGIYEGRGQGYKKRKAEEALEKKDNPAPVKPALPATIKVDDPGMMRIKNENGFLTLDLDGARVDTASFSVDQRKRLIEMLTLIRPWLEGKPAPAPTPLNPTPPQPISISQTAAAPQAPLQPIAAQPTLSPSAPSKTSTIAKEDRPAAPATSIVGQIDSVLQEQIAGTPLDERGVFLAQSPDGGVMVYVGLTKYMAIDDVPDAEIKAAIRSAITEWENKYTPGLK